MKLKVDRISNAMIVKQSSRIDVHIGDILISSGGKRINKKTWSRMFESMKEKSSKGIKQLLVFETCPGSPTVNFVRGYLSDAGIEEGCELVFVNENPVKYAYPKSLMDKIAEMPKPCILTFRKVRLPQLSDSVA